MRTVHCGARTRRRPTIAANLVVMVVAVVAPRARRRAPPAPAVPLGRIEN
jgi:hypothetical protein